MSREDLKNRIRELDNELELSTLINKGAIQEGRELKARVAELEQENGALRHTERRLTQTEERLEETEDIIKEKEAQILRLKEAVNEMKTSLRNAVKERDEWTNRWSRAADFFAKEEEDIADTAMDRATEAFTTVSLFPFCMGPKLMRKAQEKVVNNPPIRRDHSERATRRPYNQRPVVTSSSTLSALFDEEEIGGPSKARDDGQQMSSKKKRRRIGEESTPEDKAYRPTRPVVRLHYLTWVRRADSQTPVDQVKTRPPSARERKKPAIQLGIVKLETPTPEPEQPDQPAAPSKSARRRKRYDAREDGDESDDGEFFTIFRLAYSDVVALGQW